MTDAQAEYDRELKARRDADAEVQSPVSAEPWAAEPSTGRILGVGHVRADVPDVVAELEQKTAEAREHARVRAQDTHSEGRSQQEKEAIEAINRQHDGAYAEAGSAAAEMAQGGEQSAEDDVQSTQSPSAAHSADGALADALDTAAAADMDAA